jgi:hypothetical protein
VIINSHRFGMPWAPANIATALWLDAADTTTIVLSGSNVSQWSDKSGNSRNVTQSSAGNRPTYTTSGLNSRNVVTFNGSTQSMDVPALGFTGGRFAAFLVGLCNGTTNLGPYFFDSTSRTAMATNFAGTLPNRGRWFAFNQTGSQIESTTTTGNNVNAIINGVFDGTSSQIFVDGTSIASGTLAVSGFNTSFFLGRRFNGNASGTNYLGIMAEVIFCAVPTNTTRQLIEGYLAHKWGLTANLPSGHPYKNSPPMV